MCSIRIVPVKRHPQTSFQVQSHSRCCHTDRSPTTIGLCIPVELAVIQAIISIITEKFCQTVQDSPSPLFRLKMEKQYSQLKLKGIKEREAKVALLTLTLLYSNCCLPPMKPTNAGFPFPLMASKTMQSGPVEQPSVMEGPPFVTTSPLNPSSRQNAWN